MNSVEPQIERASRRAREFVLGAPDPVERELARAVGLGESPDPAAATAVAAGQLADGSWGGSLAATSRALLLLRRLGEDGASIASAQLWLRGRRRGRGGWTAGCDAARHARGVCHHFAGGFFAPAAGDGAPAVCRLAGGTRLEGEPASLALSCVALRAMLGWAGRDLDAGLHLRALRRLVLERSSLVDAGREPVATLAPMLSALAAGSDDDAAVWHGVLLVVRSQRADGSWPDVDPFSMVEALLAVSDGGYAGPALDRAIERAADLLAVTQRAEGGWERGGSGPSSTETASALTPDIIGWLALERAAATKHDRPVVH